MIVVEFPIDEDKIPAELKRLEAETKRLKAELTALGGLREAIQSFCSHPKTYKRYDYTGDYDVYCETCGARNP